MRLFSGARESDQTTQFAIAEPLEARRLLSASVDLAALMPADLGAGDLFGYSVAARGDLVLVGAPGANKAYLFDLSADTSMTFSAAPGEFGKSVAFVGDDVLIGAPATVVGGQSAVGTAYRFAADGSLQTTYLNPNAVANSFFGETVSSFGDDHVLIQTFQDQTDPAVNGRVHLFHKTDGNDEVRSFVNPSRSLDQRDNFGNAIAVSGNLILIGAPTATRGGAVAGAAFVFDATSAGSAPVVVVENPIAASHAFGSAVAFAGGEMIVGAPEYDADALGGGIVYRFSSGGALVQTYANPAPDMGTGFGTAVAVAGDTLFIGSTGDREIMEVFDEDEEDFVDFPVPVGAVYAMDIATGVQQERIVNPAPNGLFQGQDWFGFSLAPLGSAGVVIGAWGHNADDNGGILPSAGAAYVYGAQGDPGDDPLELQLTAAPELAVRYQTITFTGSISGGAPGDYLVEWNFGDGTQVSQTTADAAVSITHAYAEDGIYTVTFTVTDSAGDSETAFTTVAVAETAMEAGTLLVGGTAGADNINVNVDRSGNIIVSINGTAEVFSDVQRIAIFGGDGNDNLIVSRQVTIPAELYGIAGNNILRGGGGVNIIVGGTGDDVIIGGPQRDLLIGGRGSDRILGHQGDDILIAGHTLFDSNPGALRAVMQVWTSEQSFEARVAQLKDPEWEFRLAAGFSLFHDGSRNILTGHSGDDLFIISRDSDKVTDLQDEELAHLIDLFDYEPAPAI